MEKAKKHSNIMISVFALLVLLIIFCLFIMPATISAASKYKTMNLENSLKNEGIEYD